MGPCMSRFALCARESVDLFMVGCRRWVSHPPQELSPHIQFRSLFPLEVLGLAIHADRHY